MNDAPEREILILYESLYTGGYGDKRDSCCEVWMERSASTGGHGGTTAGGTTGLMAAPSD